MSKVNIIPGELQLDNLRQVMNPKIACVLQQEAKHNVDAATNLVAKIAAQDEPVYSINTGFGLLAHTHIPTEQLAELQKNLILSHATGVGKDLEDDVVRLLIALKINSLMQGCSGIRWQIIEMLNTLLNNNVLPCIPEKGSVGASGDLAPLSHLGCALIGVSNVKLNNEIVSAKQGLQKVGLQPVELQVKEGLALINGTQASTALALSALFKFEKCLSAAMLAGSMSLIAANGRVNVFNANIHRVRRQLGQQQVAKIFRDLLGDYKASTAEGNIVRVQDPYSLRCQPQVMGACVAQMRFAAEILLVEANAVTDNPLVFVDDEQVLSGGNFHAEPVAMAADNLALAIAEVGALAERRVALLMDSNFSGLPSFLVAHSGLNSGFMNAQVTAAALASENKALAHPSSVDSLPTSANQEDHVSMATYAARRLHSMVDNIAYILAVELLADAQAFDLRKNVQLPEKIKACYQFIRQHVSTLDEDRYMADDIEKIYQAIIQGQFQQWIDCNVENFS